MEQLTDTIGNREKLLELLREGAQNLAFSETVRKEAVRKALKLGIPTIKHEQWKYSNLEKLINQNDFSSRPAFSMDHEFLQHLPLRGNSYIRLFNGEIQQHRLPPGITVKEYDDDASQVTQSLQAIDDFWMQYNTALCRKIIRIYVADGFSSDVPLILESILASSHISMVNSRILIRLGRGSKLFLEHTQASPRDAAELFHNQVVELELAESSKLVYEMLQDECENLIQVGHIFATVFAQAELATNCITLGGKFVRNNYSINLNGSGSKAALSGLSVTTGKDLADSWIHISHSEPGCLSDQLFKAVAGDESTAVFSGKIFVAKDAQKTSAYQTSRNIVLSDHASVYTRPQLEIYADDVKCSHGATTGKIDNEALFYLRTRGIPENAARLLLLEAFMMDVLEKAEIEDFRNTSRIHILRKLSALIKKEKTL